MRFYEKTLGGKMEMMMKLSEPRPAKAAPAASPDAVMHACIDVQGRHLMASDWMSDQPYGGMSGFSLALNYPTVKEARRVFDALSAGGQVRMPIAKTFWVEAFGMLTDKYGTPWMVGGGNQA